MATGLSEAQRKNLLKSMKNEAPTKYEKVFVKLHTGDPGSAGTSNAAGETTRKEIKLKSEIPLKNESAVEWTTVSTTETYKYVSIWSESTGGTFLGSAQLEAEKSVTAGDTAKLPAEGFSITIEGA